MSKNSKKLEGFGSLQVLVTPTPETEVVEAIVGDLMALPEYAVIEQVQDLLQEKAQLLVEEKRLLDEAGTLGVQIPDLENRAGSLRGRLAQFKADVKNAVLNSDGIANIRASILGVKRLSNFLEEFADKQLENSANYTNMRDELRSLVAKANEFNSGVQSRTARAKELHQRAEELGTEARSILESITL